MSTFFKPTVERSSNVHYFHATLPANLRSKAWDNVFLIQDDVVKLTRDMGPTQLEVTARPGYNSAHSLAVLSVAVYTAMNSLEDLLNISDPRDHQILAYSQISFACGSFDSSLFIEYLSTYLVEKVEKKVASALNDIRGGYNLGWFDELSNKVINARRRLEFVPFYNFAITPWEKTRRLQMADKVIEKILKASLQAVEINQKIDGIKKSSRLMGANLIDAVKQNPLNIKDLYQTTLGYLSEAKKQAQSGFEELNHDALESEAEVFIALTPVA